MHRTKVLACCHGSAGALGAWQTERGIFIQFQEKNGQDECHHLAIPADMHRVSTTAQSVPRGLLVCHRVTLHWQLVTDLGLDEVS